MQDEHTTSSISDSEAAATTSVLSGPNPARKDARSAVLLLCFAAIVVLASIGWIAQYGNEVIHDLSPPTWQMWQAFEAPDRITAIAVGDSHTGLGLFASPLIGPVMNLGYAGESVFDTRRKVDRVLSRLPRVTTVLLQYQPHMFYPHRLGLNGESTIGKLLRDDDIWHPFGGLLPQFHKCCRAAVPGWAVRRLRGKRPVPDPKILENGYLSYRHKPSKPIDELARLEIASYGGTAIQPKLQTAYQALIGQLSSRGIRVILTRYPLSSSYRKRLGAAAFEAAEKFEVAIIKGFPNIGQCGRWDWSDDDSLFLNADHLNRNGANRYWSVIARCLGKGKATRPGVTETVGRLG